MREVPPDVLQPLVTAARRTLLDLEPEEVPAALHRIASRTGKSLPPPMARRLLKEIDTNEWLRATVRDRWSDLDVDAADGPTAASSLFLVRPDGWRERIDGLVQRHAAVRSAAVDAALEAQIAELKVEVEQARRRAKRAQRDAELATAEAERRIVAARASAASIRDDERDELRRLRVDVAELKAALASVEEDADSTRERLRQIRAELLRARRDQQPAAQPPARSVWGDLGPLEAGRLLDEVRASLSPDHAPVEAVLPFEMEPLVPPPGVRLDTSAAVDWLLGVDRMLTIVVDGYNVIHLLEGGSDGVTSMADARLRLNVSLAGMQRAASRRPHVIVVYDSSQPGGTTRESGPESLEIRFTTEGHIADDEILLLATELGARGVVVSTDRRVREGAERVGALGLWSQALVEWIRTR